MQAATCHLVKGFGGVWQHRCPGTQSLPAQPLWPSCSTDVDVNCVRDKVTRCALLQVLCASAHDVGFTM